MPEKQLRADGRKRNTAMSPRQLKELEVSFRKGESLRTAAQKADCSAGTVYSWFQKFKKKQTTA